LNRPLKGVDTWLQENKRHNIALAIACLDRVVLNPGRTFSYWKSIGNPTKKKGYLPGMVLDQGTFKAGTGGGLCQLSNLLYWMTLHTPLTVTERWRHGYDVFPDVRRTQPFGSGATCFYPFLDLAVKNETSQRFQLRVFIEGEFLVGEWRSDQINPKTYSIEERDHRIEQAPWGGYVRMNTIVRRVYELGAFLEEEIVAKNEAVMMYSPLLASSEDR
jgi:vancomycin resistance protein VanW